MINSSTSFALKFAGNQPSSLPRRLTPYHHESSSLPSSSFAFSYTSIKSPSTRAICPSPVGSKLAMAIAFSVIFSCCCLALVVVEFV
ncbi:hypothetical protein TYRP_011153 [Tyrophagus putrescentiae]|nr:hypothetical protein TYRP_011153 [Tyrophagus putrescentiae]